MFKRVIAMGFIGCLAACAATFLTPQASAQDQDHFTYVSFWAVPRANWADFEKQEKSDDATMQKLVNDGTIVAFGDATVRVHGEEGWSHANWFTATTRAATLKALEVLSGSSSATPALLTATKHADEFLHTVAHGGKSVTNATGYLRVASYQVKPGASEAFEAHFKSAMKSFVDKEIESGNLLMYNFDKEEIHSSEPGGYNLAMLFPDAAAMDKFYADLAEHAKQNPGAIEVFDNLTISQNHRDTLSWVPAYSHK